MAPAKCMGCGYIPLAHPVVNPTTLLQHRGEVLCATCLDAKRAADPDDGWYACPEWNPLGGGLMSPTVPIDARAGMRVMVNGPRPKRRHLARPDEILPFRTRSLCGVAVRPVGEFEYLHRTPACATCWRIAGVEAP